MDLQRARLLDRRLLLLHAAQRVFSTRHFITPHAQIGFQFGRRVEFGPLLRAVDQRSREGVDRAVHCFDLRRGLILRVISIERDQPLRPSRGDASRTRFLASDEDCRQALAPFRF